MSEAWLVAICNTLLYMPPPQHSKAQPTPQLSASNLRVALLAHVAVQTLEELLSLRRQVDTFKTSHEEAQQQAELLKEETAGGTGRGGRRGLNKVLINGHRPFWCTVYGFSEHKACSGSSCCMQLGFHCCTVLLQA